MPNICGAYKFEISKDGDWYIAKGKLPNGSGTMITQGRTEEEIFEMIADCYLTIYDIPCSRWSRFWHWILRLK